MPRPRRTFGSHRKHEVGLRPGIKPVVSETLAAWKDEPVRPIQKYVGSASGRLEPHLSLIEAAFEGATSYACEHIRAEGIDVIFADAPNDAIPEWGVGGATCSPYFILISVDPNFALERQNIEATLVHEYHHAMRWRVSEFSADLAQLLVSEGLAVLFEEECVGEPPFYSDANITEQEMAMANIDLHAQPFDQKKWFFGAEGITKAFGYTYGYRLCKKYSLAAGKSASELLGVSAKEVLDHSLTARQKSSK